MYAVHKGVISEISGGAITGKYQKAFIKKLCADIKVNPKHFWSFVRSRTSLKERVLRVRKQNGEINKTDVETANEMNKAF